MKRGVWRWPVPAADPRALAAATGCGQLLAEVLAGRGMAAAAASAWLQPRLADLGDWRRLPDIGPAVARLRRAAAQGERVLVFGDRDVDGMTATAVMVDALRQILPAADVVWTVPAVDEGYGLNVARVREFATPRGVTVVTVDCGVSAVAEVAELAAAGIDVIITDHHEPAALLPAAVAVVDPKRADSAYPERMLAGVGVALRFGEALLTESGCDAAAWRQRQLALAALGTVADMVPLCGENRVIAWHGLRGLADPELPGLRALRRVVKLAEPVPVGRDIAFGLAPLLNAAGRMGKNELGAQLLLCENDTAADQLVARLQELNSRRRDLGEKNLAVAEAELARQCDLAHDRFLVLGLENVAHGVTGIVAAQLQKKYRRPVAVLIVEHGVAQGTARSVEGWDLLAAVRTAEDLLTRHGGHQQAVGMSLPAARVAELRTRLNAAAALTLPAAASPPELAIDAVVDLADLTVAGAQELAALEPLGSGNAEARFATRGVTLRRHEVMGREQDHLRLQVEQRGDMAAVVAWGRADLAPRLTTGARYDILYALRAREWRGRTEAQAVLADIAPAEG